MQRKDDSSRKAAMQSETRILHSGPTSEKISDPTAEQLKQSLASLPGGDDSFVIYAKENDSCTYMQTAGSSKEGFRLEYREGTPDAHFICKQVLNLLEVQNAFSWYASGDERWKNVLPWARLDSQKEVTAKKRLPSTETESFWLTRRCLVGDYPAHGENGGKWLIFVDRSEVDQLWRKLSVATRAGILGGIIKVSTARPNPNSPDPKRHVICVYSYDYTDTVDVFRIRAALRDLGVTEKIGYKTDSATKQGLYKVAGHTRVSMFWE